MKQLTLTTKLKSLRSPSLIYIIIIVIWLGGRYCCLVQMSCKHLGNNMHHNKMHFYGRILEHSMGEKTSAIVWIHFQCGFQPLDEICSNMQWKIYFSPFNTCLTKLKCNGYQIILYLSSSL